MSNPASAEVRRIKNSHSTGRRECTRSSTILPQLKHSRAKSRPKLASSRASPRTTSVRWCNADVQTCPRTGTVSERAFHSVFPTVDSSAASSVACSIGSRQRGSTTTCASTSSTPTSSLATSAITSSTRTLATSDWIRTPICSCIHTHSLSFLTCTFTRSVVATYHFVTTATSRPPSQACTITSLMLLWFPSTAVATCCDYEKTHG
mmetsp:Transcript_11439/g.36312  ORF Transcript_11439/g.36312 Transcript_11439/m.36312 type:complete len:206 (-) Transcript_11439:785-1402(-)